MHKFKIHVLPTKPLPPKRTFDHCNLISTEERNRCCTRKSHGTPFVPGGMRCHEVDFMCQFDWDTGYPDIWSNIILSMFCEGISE